MESYIDIDAMVERLDSILLARGLSRRSLSEIDVSQQAVSGWAGSRKSKPSLESISRICKFLDISLDYFVYGDEKKAKKIFSVRAEKIARIYDSLPEEGKVIIDIATEGAAKRYPAQPQEQGDISSSTAG
ncbi:helix-turn-helix transcriptional regulator [Brucepastera parasyntrophica]|uniref:helix-turn-helix domain-containing protein n=1 Tax=Brucepastera parasyntrophica TaxID=2880008 RepID=UPI00210D5CB5|nr:helix-turn-helix transcriptional regulator [Brucepastera parasyntrophica]ULQ59212.1 helix-turn-helix transcriptional regulator [Brucepastera parasyntrophica]